MTLFWLALWLPFLAAVTIAFIIIPFERKNENKDFFRGLSANTAIGAIGASFILTLITLFKNMGHHIKPMESSIDWIAWAGLHIEFGILFDGLTLLMMLVVTGVALLVVLFSSQYMKGEEGYSRYFSALSLFVFSMLGIVFANNFIQMFIFWELVGLSSYLLIGFWFDKPSAAVACKKAFLTTRVGDVGMMIGILLIFTALVQEGHGSFNFLELKDYFHHAHLPSGLLAGGCIALFLGAMGKSAQVPLQVWLPDAMEGPTPASALIHAATMVAAGVFMVARLFFLFEMSPEALTFIAWVGGLTAFIAATIAVVQDDIKKVLAYSTLSQLGYMVLALGVGSAESGMFHLTTHAFFKALLFLGAGSLIHAMHTQDIWEMQQIVGAEKSKGKGLLKLMPITGWTFLIGTAALMGIPFTSGFFSKEYVLDAAMKGPVVLFILAMAVVFLTSFYMSRVITVVFFSAAKPKAPEHPAHPHEDNWKVTIPLIILGVFSLIAGYLPFKSLMDFGHGHDGHHKVSYVLMFSAIAVTFLGAGVGYFLYRNKTEEKHLPALSSAVAFLKNKYGFDDFYDWLITNVQDNIAKFADFFERIFVVEGAVNGLAKITGKAGDWARKMQTGFIQTYVFVFALGITLLVFYFVYMGGRS